MEQNGALSSSMFDSVQEYESRIEIKEGKHIREKESWHKVK